MPSVRVRSARPLRTSPAGLPAGLREEVTLLTEVLDDVVGECEGEDLVDLVAWVRDATIDRRETGDRDVEPLLAELARLDTRTAHKLARALTIHCQLVNLADDRQRIRTARVQGRDGQVTDDGIVAGVAEVDALEGRGAAARLVHRLRVHPVFTAHPTEARRRAVVEALQRIGGQMRRLDEVEIDDALAQDVRLRLAEEVAALWRTAPFRHERPAPLDEVRRVLAVFDQTVFDLVPEVYREVDRALDPETAGPRPPLPPAFLRYGSWVGGDRDGNPHVTAEVTRATGELHAERALWLLEDATRAAARLLTASTRHDAPATPELEASLAADRAFAPERADYLDRTSPDQPHRHKLVYAADRLAAARDGRAGGYADPSEFAYDLGLVQDSLAAAGLDRVAHGRVQDVRWRVETFGFHLASLEVRQHSAVHARVLDELVPGAAGDAATLDALARDGWPAGTEPSSDEACEVLATIATMAELQQRYGWEACHRYIVSFTTSAADLLAVRALARLAVDPDTHAGFRLDVVPLFETRADLERAPAVLGELLDQPGERARLDADGRRVEVMIGYSDSAKDAGVLAAHVALYQLQDELARWAREQDVELTLFHGRGGSMGRGGGPLNRAIRGQGGGSVDGRLKVTEQGEVIFARYRSTATGRRHLERTVNAVLATSTSHAEQRAWRHRERFAAVAEQMARASEQAYRDLVESEGFAEFFGTVTPHDEIGGLQIGSRPTHRTRARDLASLRAIPWVFAWSQSRVNLTGWFGLGTGLEAVGSQDGGLETLRTMRREWGFFAPVLEMAEMSLAKADRTLGERALALGQRPDLAERILAEWDRTERWLLAVTGQDRLLERQPALRAAIALRRPDVDALTLLQLAWLDRLRAAGEDADPAWSEVVKMTVAGLSAGLQNTG